MWIGNAKKRRAYKVARYIKARDAYRCVNKYGRYFVLTAEQLSAAGYVVLKRKPRYAMSRGTSAAQSRVAA